MGPQPEIIGRTLGHYRIEKKLGQGGMGAVYLAMDTHLDRPVAVKVLLADAVANPERKKRFVQEARAASALNHPNIVHVYDIGQDDGVDYMALEFVPGQTLDRVTGSGLSVGDTVKYAVQIADALATAHAAGIVHRDIKPSNLIVNDKGLVKVLDFGLAKLADPVEVDLDVPTETLLTREGAILGTAAYMSPEQALGKRVDARSDVFALGAVLYEMLTGRRAFARGTALATLGAVLHEEPAPLARITKDAPEIEQLVEACLRKDPEQRIQTMALVKAALEELQEPARTGRSSTLVRAKPRRWWIAAVSAGAIAAAGVAVFFWLRTDAPPATKEAVIRPLTSMTGWETFPAWSPDGTMIAFSNNIEGSMDVFVKPVAGGDPIRLTRGPADEVGARWSPDGRFLAYSADPGTGTKVYLIPPLGGAERKLVETNLTQFTSALGTTPWSPRDSQELLFTRVLPAGGAAIFRVNIATNAESQVTFPGPGESDGDASWSFDGAQISFHRIKDGRGSLWTLPAVGGQPSLVTGESAWGGSAWSADGKRIFFISPRAGHLNLWDIDIASKRMQQHTTGPTWDQFPIVSSKGRLGYVSFRHQVDLYSRNVESGEEERVTANSGENFFPSLSRDARRLVYQSDRTGDNDIWMVDRDAKTERNLSDNKAADLTPDWSPDGREIVFVSTREGQPQVWLMDTEGGSLRRLTTQMVPAPGNSWSDGQVAPKWSPDGTMIAFIAVTDRGEALWVANRDGSNARPVLYGVSYHDWYRDNRHIIFTRSPKNGLVEIRAYDLERREETVLLGDWAIELDVSPDGRSLLYTHSLSHFNMNLHVLPLQAGPDGMPRAAGKPRQITNGKAEWHVHKGQWSPDGKTIVYTRDADQGDIYTIENYK